MTSDDGEVTQLQKAMNRGGDPPRATDRLLPLVYS